MKAKHIILALAAVTSMGLNSCGNGSGKGNDLDNATRADSISNLLGQLYADDYWRLTASDSATFAGQEAMSQYRRGIEKGLSVANESDAYISGLVTGIDIARYSREKMEKEYNLTISAKELLKGLDFGLKNDSAVNLEEVQVMLNQIQTQLNIEKAKRDRQNADAALSVFADAHHLKPVAPNLYASTLTPGEGSEIVAGEVVEANVKAVNASDGKELNVPIGHQFKAGPNVTGLPVSQYLIGMKVGECKQFTTSALEFLGNRCSRYGVSPETIVAVTVQVRDKSDALQE